MAKTLVEFKNQHGFNPIEDSTSDDVAILARNLEELTLAHFICWDEDKNVYIDSFHWTQSLK